MTTSLSVYGLNGASATLPGAHTLATATGGTGANISTKVGTATGWGEIQGSSNPWGALGSIGSQSGGGWLLDSTLLEGQELIAGTWGASIRLSTSAGSITATITMRASKYNATSATYTTIGSLTSTSVTINTTLTTFTLSSANLPAMIFATGDKLYIDVWLDVTTNSTGSSTATINCSVSSTTTGLAGRVEMDTAGYQPYGQKDFSLRARIAQAKNFALRARVAQTRNWSLRARVQNAANSRAKDFALRVRIAQSKDFRLRARLAQSKDFKMRARLARAKDFALRAAIQSPGVLATDTFIRVNQSGWGIASDGETWAYIDGSQASSIVSDAGQITRGTGSALFVLGSKTAAAVDLKIRAYITGAAGDRMGVLARLQNTTTYYRMAWEGGGNLKIEKSLADTVTTLASSAYSVTSLQYYWIRAQIYDVASGTQINAKIWQDGTTEPSSWTVTTTDINPLTGAGQFGVYLFTGSSSNVVSVNNFTALSLTNPRDFALRARIGGRGLQDIALRARVGGFPHWKDYALRARMRGLGIRDFALRASLDNAVIALPAYTPGALSVTISGTTYPILEGSLKISEDITGRSTCSFTLLDPTGNVHFRFRQPVIVTHSQRGQLFRGFVDTPQEQNLPPNTANEIQISCIDEHWLADKRAYEGDEFVNQYAGDIATFYAQELAQDGVSQGYAIDHDTTQADFSDGTLSNVVAAANIGSTNIGDGDLELAPAGTALTILEGTLGDFLSGTLTNTQANGLYGPDLNSAGYLSLQVQNGIKLTGSATIAGGGNLYSYVKIWQGSYTIQSGDALSYRVWIASTSPEIKSAVDIVFTDGSTLRDSSCIDQQGIGAHPNNDLSFFASDQWYTRNIPLASLAGKTTAYVTVAFEGDSTGDYAAYFENIQLGSTTIFNGSRLNVSPAQQMQNAGYTNVQVVVQGLFEKTGYRISPAYDLSGVVIARSSLISWQDTTTQTDNGIFALAAKGVTVTVESSLDGGVTWQSCTSGQPIPGLLPGMSLAGKSLMLRETITNGSGDATQTAAFYALQATIEPSFAGSQKVDITRIVTSQQDWQNATLTNLLWQNGALGLNGYYLNWGNAQLGGMTIFGSASPSAGIFETELVLHSGTGAACVARLDNAGSWQNFIAECDVYVGVGNGNYGFVYRTTGWQNNNDTYAYSAFVNTSQIALGKGTNSSSGAGAFTLIQSATLALSSGNWHRLKVVVNGSTHQLYLDDVLYITATDSTYTGAGQFGLRYYNNSGATAAGNFGDFGVVQALSGTRISPAFDLSSAKSVQDSYIAWTASTPGSSTVNVEVSTDGGNTWIAALPNASIYGYTGLLVPGQSLQGMKLQTRVTLTSATATQQPTISGLSWWVIGTMTAAGYRLNPPLALGPVGRVGSSLVNWTATLPNDDTTVGVDVSLDGVNWTDVSGLNGQPIPLFTAQQDPPFIDTFTSDNTASYTSGNIIAPGNFAAPWSVFTPGRYIVGTGGQGALLVMTTLQGDGEIWIDTDWCDNGGVVWALSADATTCYLLQIQDGSASRTPNRMRLFKVVNGAYSQLGEGAALSFTRGTPTRFQIVQLNGTITITVHSAAANPDGAVYGDLAQTLTYTDPSPLLPGSVALYSNGGTNRYYQLRVMAYGQDVTQATLYARLRLTTTDPTSTPQIQDFVIAVRSPAIATGVLIPTTTHSSKSGSTNTIAQNLDDCARQSSITDTYWWRILNGVLYFQPQTASMAPWIATPQLMLAANITVSYDASLYRNEQIVIGGTDIQNNIETYVADGFSQAFTTGDPIESVTAILVNGQPQSFGVEKVDTGKQWYYQIGKSGITQDANALPLPQGTRIQIQYQGQVNVIAKARNNGQIALMASIDGTSGIVTVIEQAQGLNSAAAQTLAQARIAQYAKLAKTISFTTNRPGLHMGQVLTVFLPQHGIQNESFLVTQVDYQPITALIGGSVTLLEQYKVTCTSGPVVGGFQHLFG